MKLARLCVRVDKETLEQVNIVFQKQGLSVETAINSYLKFVAHYQCIPFPLTLNRANDIGEDAVKLEEGISKSIREHIDQIEANGNPVAL